MKLHLSLIPLSLISSHLLAEPLTISVSPPAAPRTDGFKMGTSANPQGETLALNSQSLLLNGKPWMPVMGEFHYSRYPESEWRDELLKMKAGGIDIVATYVFWNHHEEEEGKWNWSGQRDLKRFIQLCKETGLKVAVRCGPWCHGEVRNGGVPDWALSKGWKFRSNDPAYLDHTKIIYQQIATQLGGLLWKDGGPVVAIQLENEFRGKAEHLLALKKIAQEVGLDVPLYTRTGWPELTSPMPFGEITPLFGAYAEGFWDRSLSSMPGNYWAAYRFMNVRTDTAIATEALGQRTIKDEADTANYPFLTCELGGGMMSAYHRRILMPGEDVTAVALSKIGSGGNMPGYYMYQGGINPEGKLTTLMEAQDTPMTNNNDLPVKNYDFQAPLGSYGQVRPHYHSLRRLHLMVRDFGGLLAPMPAVMPDVQPVGKADVSTLRWSVRSGGDGGFIFVNNHQRAANLPAHEGVQFSIKTANGTAVVPAQPITIPADAQFVWPYRLDLGHGVRLESATAQPICLINEENQRTFFFAETPGIPANFTFSNGSRQTLKPGHDIAFKIGAADAQTRIVLLDDADSLALWKGNLAGRDRVVLTRANAIFDSDKLRLQSENAASLTASVYPPINASDPADGIFGKLPLDAIAPKTFAARVQQEKPAGPPRDILMGKSKIAAAPHDADFAAAAVWSIQLPTDFDPAKTDALLRIHYKGDVARVKIGGKLVMDDFYNGLALEIGLKRYAAEIQKAGGLTLEILPLRADAPIYLANRPAAGSPPTLSLDAVNLVPIYQTTTR